MVNHTPIDKTITPDMRRAILKWIGQAAVGLVGYGVVLVLAVGRWDWAWGWVMLGVITAFMAAHPLILVPLNPALLVERGKGLGDEGVKWWDRWVAALGGGVLPMLSWVVAGLDVRYGWTGPLAEGWHLLGLLLNIVGYGVFLWAMAANAFFAEGVRIQEERGHTVASGGPYRVVRHPGYAGAMLAMLGTPFLLGSGWSAIPMAGAAAAYILRTWLEDRTLLAELPGYVDYARRTRYRLLPGLW